MLLTNNWFMYEVKAFGLHTGSPKDREWEMIPIGANSDWNVKHEKYGEVYGRSFRLQINNPKNRIWYRILDPTAPSKPSDKDTPENAFIHARRMVLEMEVD